MKFRLACVAMFVFLLSTMALAQKVYVDFNHSVDFSKFKTYAWGQGPNPNAIQDSILLQNAQSEINSQLQAHGMQMVQESQNPDVIVVLSSGVKQETTYNAWGTGGWRWGGGMGEITPDVSNIGTLVVDIYEAAGQRMVWRGVAQDTLSTKSDKNNKMINKAVTKMFEKYPGAASGATTSNY